VSQETSQTTPQDRFRKRQRVITVLTLCAGLLFLQAAIVIGVLGTVATLGEGITFAQVALLALAATAAVFLLLSVGSAVLLAFEQWRRDR
jgi:hypothetical protein